MVERLLKVEHDDKPAEIVIHVNMLNEGWDVNKKLGPANGSLWRMIPRACKSDW